MQDFATSHVTINIKKTSELLNT